MTRFGIGGARALLAMAVASAAMAADASAPSVAPPWGQTGHEIAAMAATEALPSAMPAFFRAAAGQLVYLNPEPDRWRVRAAREMDQAFAYDHYIDLENVPKDALNARNRFTFLRVLYQAGIARPERDVGFLPYRIIELYQRTVASWRRWREEEDPQRRAWIEERIVADAGILGHYVTDASQPHHTTIHFNGWDAETPNPRGYTRANDFHRRFETSFVEEHVTQADVRRHMPRGRIGSVAGGVREAVLEHIMEAHAEVERLYQLEKDHGFRPAERPSRESRDFAASRLASGAHMLAVLWWSAWLESETASEGDEGAS